MSSSGTTTDTADAGWADDRPEGADSGRAANGPDRSHGADRSLLPEPGTGGRPLPTGPEKLRMVRQMFDAIAEHYEALNHLMSLGLDRHWRRRCVAALDLPPGSRVLDMACGTGDLCRQLAGSGIVAVGADLSSGMLARARTSAPLVLADGLAAPFRDAAFDGAVSGFALRNVVDLSDLFAELARAVRPGGRISLLDLTEPENPVLRAGHRIWSNYAVPFLGSMLSDADAYRYLPQSLAYLPTPEQMTALLEQAGFRGVQRELLSGGIAQLFVATRARPAPGPSEPVA